ncbi:MAG: hypothetical protein HUJ26_12630 [Planctomycetaceae bacterium]|nr:hypothetical protein [Planctomycetaceae bacterium]
MSRYEITESKQRLGGKKPPSNTPRPPAPKGSGVSKDTRIAELEQQLAESERKAAALDWLEIARKARLYDALEDPEGRAEIAHKLSAIVHERCENVPHDIGLTLIDAFLEWAKGQE